MVLIVIGGIFLLAIIIVLIMIRNKSKVETRMEGLKSKAYNARMSVDSRMFASRPSISDIGNVNVFESSSDVTAPRRPPQPLAFPVSE